MSKSLQSGSLPHTTYSAVFHEVAKLRPHGFEVAYSCALFARIAKRGVCFIHPLLKCILEESGTDEEKEESGTDGAFPFWNPSY